MHRALVFYQQAWEQRRIELLDECFTEDAVYVFRPPALARPCNGLAEIKRYWQDRVLSEQESARFTVLRTVEIGRQLWCEWWAEAAMPMLRPGNDVFSMWGVMICDLAADGKFKRLVEYYFWDPQQRERLQKARQSASPNEA